MDATTTSAWSASARFDGRRRRRDRTDAFLSDRRRAALLDRRAPVVVPGYGGDGPELHRHVDSGQWYARRLPGDDRSLSRRDRPAPGAGYTWSVSASDGSTSAASVDATFSVFQAVASGAGTAVASWPVAGGARHPSCARASPRSRGGSTAGARRSPAFRSSGVRTPRSRPSRSRAASEMPTPRRSRSRRRLTGRRRTTGASVPSLRAKALRRPGARVIRHARIGRLARARRLVPDRRSDDLHRRCDALMVRLGRCGCGARLHRRVRYLVRFHRRRVANTNASPLVVRRWSQGRRISGASARGSPAAGDSWSSPRRASR